MQPFLLGVEYHFQIRHFPGEVFFDRSTEMGLIAIVGAGKGFAMLAGKQRVLGSRAIAIGSGQAVLWTVPERGPDGCLVLR